MQVQNIRIQLKKSKVKSKVQPTTALSMIPPQLYPIEIKLKMNNEKNVQ